VARGLERFLVEYPGMRVKPSRGAGLLLEGVLSFHVEVPKEITDSYRLRIIVPELFPADLPNVTELDFKIPRHESYHVNPDATLCLGSPIRILQKLSRHPSLIGFAESCLVPYLFAISHKLRFGGELPFSELPHGTKGMLDDYIEMFGLKTRSEAATAIRLLAMKKRLANKHKCPCGCSRRVGKCDFNWTLRKFRRLASRAWFRKACV
jgi:hypothetical protein